MLRRMKLSRRLLVSFLMVSIIPMIAVGVIIDLKATDALSHRAFAELTAVRAIKGEKIKDYFSGLTNDIEILAESILVFRQEAQNTLEGVKKAKTGEITAFFRKLEEDVTVLAELDAVQSLFRALDKYHARTSAGDDNPYLIDSDAYRKIYRQQGTRVLRFARQHGFEDVVIIDAAHGHVMFSSAKRDDMGSNLRFGPFRDSVLHKLWQKVLKSGKPEMVDFESYAANGGKPTAYIGAPMEMDGKVQGVVAIQIPMAEINRIMMDHTGLGEMGQTYLVGTDLLMRSDSVQEPANHSVIASFSDPAKGKMDTSAVRRALKGESGVDILKDEGGKAMLTAWAPLRIMGIEWAFIAEIALEETLNLKVDTDKKAFLQQFQALQGFYDLFLIDGSGYIFYTVAREPDYQTNLLTGPYSNSNLGHLVAQVLETGKGGFVDFEPYAPSDNKPAAFFAAPVKRGDKVEMVVALQVSIDEINRIMQQREGLGDTGETYLVGPDKRMRSNSYLDPQNHSIIASFAGTVERNGIDTVASQEALNGRPGTRIIADYRGIPVLSSYAPVKIGPYTWAVIAEIDEAEAFAAIDELNWLLLLIFSVMVVMIIAVSLWLASSITRPITDAVGLASAVAGGRLDCELNSHREDEVGQLIDNLNSMSGRLRDIVGKVRSAIDNVVTAASEITKGNMDLSQRTEEEASSLEETAASMEELTSTVKSNADNAAQANQLTIEARKRAEDGGSVAGHAMEAMTAIKESSKRIVDIIGVIDEIAFQTNLLSLNAAVEAARAGEHGRGFAVVSDEVRKLAQRSADAAKEIKALISDSVGKVDEGNHLVEESGKALSEIITSVQQVSDIVAEITAASREQSVGIEQVNKTVVQMDEVTQQNAALVEEAAAAAASLEEQAKQLQRSLAFFKLQENEQLLSGSAHLLPPSMPRPPVTEQALPVRTRHQSRQAEKSVSVDEDEWEEF